MSSARHQHVSRFGESVSLAFAVFVVLLIGIVSYFDFSQIRKDREELKATRAIRTVTDGLLLAVKDAEAAQRGFLLTGKVAYLQPTPERTAAIQARLDALDGLIADRTPQQSRLDRLKVLIGAKLAELEETIRARQTQSADAALAIVMSDRGKILMDQIRATADEITAVSDRRVAELTANAQARSDRTRFVSVGGSVILLILFSAATVIINRATRRRQQLTETIAEKEFETARARDVLQTTLSSIADAVIATDASGSITFLNPAAELLTGWGANLAAGKPAGEIFHIVNEATLEPIESPLARSLREGRAVGLANHTLLIAKDGRRIAIDDSAAPMLDESGKIAGAVLVFRDISSRRNAERNLEESEKRFRTAFVRAPIGMVLTSVDGKFVYSNQTYSDITGYAPSELPEISFLSLAHPEEALENRALFNQLLAGAIPSYVIEKRIFRKNGETIWVRASATVLRDGDGRVAQVVGLVEDIDARKRAESMVAWKARLAELSADVGRALTQADSLREALQLCAQAMVDHLDATFARMWTVNGAGDLLELEASAGIYTHLNGSHARIPVGSFKIGMIAKERKPHLTNNVATDEQVSDRAWAAENGIVAFAGYPLIVRERLVGVMGMFSRNLFSSETLEALGSVANSIAVGIERKRGEDALRRQWLMFDTALSNTPDFAYTFDLNGRFSYVNRALLDLWQKSLEEALGKNFFDLEYPPDLAGRLQRQIQQVIDTRQPLRDHTPYTGASGNSGYYEYIFVPVFALDGRVEAVAGSTRDVTENRRAEEELRKSEERLSFALTAGGGVGTWDWNVSENRVYCNARFAELFSIDPESAAQGAPLSAFIEGIHPDDRARVSDRIEQTMVSGEDFAAEYRLQRSDGSIRWVYARGRCHQDASGTPARFPGVVFDITDRKKVEEDLRGSETRLRFVAESIPPMVWTATPDGALDYVNRRGTEYFGVEEKTLLGTGWLAMIHPEDQPKTIERWRESLSTGQAYETSFRLLRGMDSIWRWHLVRALPFLDEAGAIVQWFGTCTDIEDQKVAEADLLRANRELEEFAYVASHDLQEPLRIGEYLYPTAAPAIRRPGTGRAEVRRIRHPGRSPNGGFD